MNERSKIGQLSGDLLEGLRQWEWVPILVVRVSMGVFFCISGGNKLFIPEQFQKMLETITQSGIPFPYLLISSLVCTRS